MMSQKFKIILGVILIFGLVALWGIHRWYQSVDSLTSLEKYGVYLRKEFPGVEHISTSSLETLLRSREAGAEPLILIDCRQPEEYRISHIAGALNFESVEELKQYLEDQGPASGPDIVVYCSVGYRSAMLAKALQENGISNVKNVLGSIFSWANEDRPLVDNGGNPAAKVHPYNQFWGRHLADGKAFELEN